MPEQNFTQGIIEGSQDTKPASTTSETEINQLKELPQSKRTNKYSSINKSK